MKQYKLPLISIIVPVYNVEEYLDECLESIVHQTYTNIEIICIDDGSTDKSSEILGRWSESDKRIRVICQENQGISGARNTGLDNASGEYIGFVDSDDYIEPQMYAKLYDAIESTNADLSISPISLTPYNKYKYKATYTLTGREALSLIGERKLRCHVWNKLYRAPILRDIRFIVGMNYEDNPFTCDVLSAADKVTVTDGGMYHYCVRKGSTTHTITVKSQQDYTRSVEYLKNSIHKAGITPKDSFCSYELNVYEGLYLLDHISKENVEEKKSIRRRLNEKRADITRIYFRHFFYLLLSKPTSFIKCTVIVLLPFLQKTMYIRKNDKKANN